MNIDKYFKILQQINTFFEEKNPFWEKVKAQAIAQNHWLNHGFIDLKVELIRDAFLEKENHSRIQSLFRQSKKRSPKIALVIEDNAMFSGIYELLIGCLLDAHVEIKCLPYQKTLLNPVIEILNQDQESSFFVDKISKKNDFYCFYKKKKISCTEKEYLQKYPYIVHTPQKGVVIIEGDETNEKLEFLANQIFSFFGLDNLNVSKILVPKGYCMDRLFESFDGYSFLKNYPHYLLQYEYHLGITILHKKEYFTNGFITLVESQEVQAPMSILNFEYYTDPPCLLSEKKDNDSFVITANTLDKNTMKKQEFENSKKAERLYAFLTQ